MKCCALFSVVGESKSNFPMGREIKLLLINMPFEASLGDDMAKVDHVFTKCERKPQSQLVQVRSTAENGVWCILRIYCFDIS